ncbi:MAG TPA: hypothetical protein VMC03_11965 [Streptosporangiaceae bacterium]|nr:hypothetical protein [Streptosporangiaceae bacterium]
MRRESSTVVVLVGEVGDGLLAGLAKSPGVSVARSLAADGGRPDADDTAAPRPGWEAGALALRAATRHRSMYVIVPDDPLAEVAAGWRAMWEVPGPAGVSPGAAGFERHAAEALAAWRGKRFELPDYYLVIAPAQGTDAGPDLYLGPLRAIRPRRVAVAATADSAAQVPAVLSTLRSLQHGPWWPPLDEMLDAARTFYAGGLAETQQILG